MGGYVVLIIISVIINLVVFYYLIRGAVNSALSENLNQYIAPREILNTLKQIESRLSELLLSAKPAEPPTKNIEEPEKRNNLKDEEKGIARLVNGDTDFSWECSICGAKQNKDRSFCFKCGATFINGSDNEMKPIMFEVRDAFLIANPPPYSTFGSCSECGHGQPIGNKTCTKCNAIFVNSD